MGAFCIEVGGNLISSLCLPVSLSLFLGCLTLFGVCAETLQRHLTALLLERSDLTEDQRVHSLLEDYGRSGLQRCAAPNVAFVCLVFFLRCGVHAV